MSALLFSCGLPREVREHEALSGRAGRTLAYVLTILAGWCRRWGGRSCWVGNKTLAGDVGVCRGHFGRLLHRLAVAGLVEIQPDSNPTGRLITLPWLSAPPSAPEPPVPLRVRQRKGPYVCASAKATTCAPARPQGSEEERKKRNAGGVVCQEGHTPPATEAEAEADVDPRSPVEIWAEIRGKQAPPAPPPAPKPPAAPLNNHGRLADAVGTAELARAAAELAAHKAARLAAAAGPAADPQAAPEATAGPVTPAGWLGRVLNRLRE